MTNRLPTAALDQIDLLGRAVEKAGGVRALARELNWNPGSMMNVRAGEKISPYRAGQLADFIGQDRKATVIAALVNKSKTADEAAYWRTFSL